MEILRGDIFYVARQGYINDGSEQGAGRPAVIVSSNQGNESSRNVTVVWLTTQDKKPLMTHCEVIARSKSTALCEGVTTISKDRLLDYVRTCTDEEMEKIDECLMLALGLKSSVDPFEEIAHEQKQQIEEMKIDLDIALKNADFYKKECEEAQALCSKAIGESESLLDEYNKLKAELKTPKRFDDETVIKLETERDLYKTQAEKLFERLLER